LLLLLITSNIQEIDIYRFSIDSLVFHFFIFIFIFNITCDIMC